MSLELPLRPRLSRYDRPALDLAELMKGEGTDFVFQAVWTIEGRRPERAQHERLLALLEGTDSKAAVLAALVESAREVGGPPTLPGLALMVLVERRRNTPIIGPLLARATLLSDRHPGFALPVRFARKLPGKVRWTYRHARKLLIRLASGIGLPSRTEFRRKLGVARAAPAPGMSERASAIYLRLCDAIDGAGGEG